MTAGGNGTSADVALVDLDAQRAARQETIGVGPKVRLGGVDWPLPATPPALIFIAIGRLQRGQLGGLEDVLAALFGAENVDQVLASGFEMDDLAPILSGCYGVSLGELPASGG